MPSFRVTATAVVIAAVLSSARVGVALCQPNGPAPGAEPTPPQGPLKEPFETAFPAIKAYAGGGDECRRITGNIPVSRTATDPSRRLAQERLAALVEASAKCETLIKGHAWDVPSLGNWLKIRRDIVRVAEDVFGPGDELVHWYEEWVATSKGLENTIQRRFQSGMARQQHVEQVRAERLYAERELLLVIARVKAGNKK